MKAIATKYSCILILFTLCSVLAVSYGLFLTYHWYFTAESAPNTVWKNGAIVSNGDECAAVGRSMIEKGGTAADAIISVLLCEGVAIPHALGIGGGFIATIYNRKSGTVESLVAREMAPAAAHSHMYVNISSLHGAKTIAVPGELKGYWELHQKYGKLPWRQLFEPAIEMCKRGVRVTNFLYISMLENEETVLTEPTFQGLFTDPITRKMRRVNDLIYRPYLAKTLETIAEKGADALYYGQVGRNLVQDIKERGGIITQEDLANYKVKWTLPTKITLKNDYTVYSTPLPGGGAVLSMILNIMNDILTEEKPIFWHRLMESFKHAYGRRSLLGDIDYEPQVEEVFRNMTDPKFAADIRNKIYDHGVINNMDHYGAKFTAAEDHGTAAMSIIHPNGDAISITSTINDNFGSKIRSMKTGIILNDNMDDFSTPDAINYYGYPPTPLNFIKPGKRPLSSMSPSIIVDKHGDVRMTVGAAGGSKIPTSIAQVVIRYLYFNEPLNETVQSPRLHHQLAPKLLKYEVGFNTTILKELEKRGHILEQLKAEEGFSALTAIGAKTNVPEPVFDLRRGGSRAVVYV